MDDVHRAVELMVAVGRLRRLRRGVYHIAGQRSPTLVEWLQAVHPQDALVVTGRWAAHMYLARAALPVVHVKRRLQARDTPIGPRTLSDHSKALEVRYVRSPVVGLPGVRVADPAETVLDLLAHPTWAPLSLTRALIEHMGHWPEHVVPVAANDRRRLAVLVDELLGQDLGWAVGASHATIDLDVTAPSEGEIITRWRVRRNG